MEPLPTGGLPGNQTVEGGGQIRVSANGFKKLTGLLPNIVDSALGSSGICISGGSFGASVAGFDLATADYCNENSGPTCTNGCLIHASLNPSGTSLSVDGNQLQMNISTSVSTSIDLSFIALGFDVYDCTLGLSSNNLNGSFDIDFDIQGSNGELGLSTQTNSFQLNLTPTGCGAISTILNLVGNIADDIPSSIQSLLSPVINNLIQGLLPNPLGLENSIDVGSFLQSFSPTTEGTLETRLVPGGYVTLEGSGMDLGLITGFNSDIDPSTRQAGTRPDGVPWVSEPSLCVPPLPAPSYTLPAAPARSAITNGTPYALNMAPEFSSAGDGSNDITIGLSQTALDLAGHHAVTSGAVCLGIGTEQISELNVGTIALLVPSLAPLEDSTGNDPLLLVTRPQRDITFTVGDNTGSASPALTVNISHLQVDFYAFLFQRYVRAFTLDLTLNAGVLLDFQQMGSATEIEPMITGIDASSVTLQVLNSEFVKETPAQLQMVLPSVFSLVGPLLGNIPAITVPSFAGLSLQDLSVKKVTTSEDTFLALTANLGAGFEDDGPTHVDQPPSMGTSSVAAVSAPKPDVVLRGLNKQPGGAMPSVTFNVDRYDGMGRELEWAWNVNGSLFHPWTSASPLVVSDPAFAWQGKYTIGLKSRVKGDYRTASEVAEYPVTIDSAGPRVMVDQATWDDDHEKITIPVWDVVDGLDVQVAFGKPGAAQPATQWTYQGNAALDQSTIDSLAVNGQVAVFARDDSGNVTVELLATGGTTEASGCNAVGAPSSGALVLFAIVGLFVLRKRRRGLFRSRSRALRAAALWVGAAAASSLVPACSCNNKSQACETTADCPACGSNQLPFCVDNMCICNADVPPGEIGPYSDVVAAADGSVWVSAYAQTYGDLVVAHTTGSGRIPDETWQWVDGVPSGPVTVPGSMIRGGITDGGPDVGMYTSIALEQDGTPVVSYFDVDRGTLKLAAYVGSAWTTSDVDAGTGSLASSGDSEVGMFSSLNVRTDTGVPTIAYLAQVNDGSGTHAELRYATANVALPSGPTDWQTTVVDMAALPDGSGDVYPLPGGMGLWISAALSPVDQSPAVAYYDRGAGELKLAKSSGGQWGAPVVLDGSMPGGASDDGWWPSLALDGSGMAHVAYASATANQLRYISEGGSAAVVDDGYRIAGMTVDGLPEPVYDFVGANASIVMLAGNPYIAYQDATTQELLLANYHGSDATWAHTSIAGATNPWPGAYGFYAADTTQAQNIVMSTWVVDQPTNENWVEVFSKPITLLQ